MKSKKRFTKLFGDEKLRLIKEALHPAYHYRNSFAVSTTWSPDFGNEYFKLFLGVSTDGDIQQETHRIRNGVDRVAQVSYDFNNLFSIIDLRFLERSKHKHILTGKKPFIVFRRLMGRNCILITIMAVSKVNTFHGVGWKMPNQKGVDSFYGTHFYNIYSTKNRPSVKYPASADPAVAEQIL